MNRELLYYNICVVLEALQYWKMGIGGQCLHCNHHSNHENKSRNIHGTLKWGETFFFSAMI